MANLPKGVQIFELPPRLEKYVQEKTASGLGKVRLLPFAFPVFVMNPSEYTVISDEPFKETLHDHVTSPLSTAWYSTAVPSGEKWEINAICGQSSGNPVTQTLGVLDGAQDHVLKKVLNETSIAWSGQIMLTEGLRIRYYQSDALGNITLDCIGRILYV